MNTNILHISLAVYTTPYQVNSAIFQQLLVASVCTQSPEVPKFLTILHLVFFNRYHFVSHWWK